MPGKRHPRRIAVLLSTVPDARTGRRLARALVAEKLAACVNIVPGLESLYHWQGRMHRDAEALLVIKTSLSAAPRTMRRLRELHPYDVPEIVRLNSADVLAAYGAWVSTRTR